jgi:hypothetical protein
MRCQKRLSMHRRQGYKAVLDLARRILCGLSTPLRLGAKRCDRDRRQKDQQSGHGLCSAFAKMLHQAAWQELCLHRWHEARAHDLPKTGKRELKLPPLTPTLQGT